MPCMCGDICCPSCGPAQGNGRCPICGQWESDGGCEDPRACDSKIRVMETEMFREEMFWGIIETLAEQAGRPLIDYECPTKLWNQLNEMSPEELGMFHGKLKKLTKQLDKFDQKMLDRLQEAEDILDHIENN